MATDVKAVLKVEGEDSFAQAFKNATSSVKALDSAVKANKAAFDNTGDKMTNLKERSTLLRQEIDAQQKVIKLAKEELERLKKEYGEGSTEANNYESKVNKATARLEDMKTALDQNTTAMEELGKESQSTGEKLQAVGDKITNIGSSIRWLSAGAAATLTGMFNAASDLNENINKTEVVFGDLSEEIEAFSKTTLKSFGIAESSALEMSAFFGDMATSMGLTTEQAAEMGKELVGRAGDMASFKNVSLEVAQNGLAAIFTGQAQSLKKFGIVMTEANLQAFALAQGISKQYSEMDQAEKVMLRYQYVMEMTKNAAGDFANTSDGAANSVRVAQETFKEAAATLGQEVIPLVLPLIQGVTDIVQGINSLDEGTKNLIVTGLAVTAVASPILTIGGKMITGIGWLIGTGFPKMGSLIGSTASTAIQACSEISVAIGGVTMSLGTALAAVALLAGAMVGLIALLDSYEDKKNRALLNERMNNINSNYKKIDPSQRDYYNASDLVGVWNGTGWDEYVKNGASMTTTGRREYIADSMERDSVENVTNYNFDVNVQQISDLQDLLDMADNAQLYDRMGVFN